MQKSIRFLWLSFANTMCRVSLVSTEKFPKCRAENYTDICITMSIAIEK